MPTSAIVIFYLLYLSWATLCFTLPSLSRFPEYPSRKGKMLKAFSIMQSYTIFAFALTVLINATTFGNTPHCNVNAVFVVFRPFSALHAGRIVFWVLSTVVIIVYTLVTLWEYVPSQVKLAYQRVRKSKVPNPVAQGPVPDLEFLESERPRSNLPPPVLLPSHGGKSEVDEMPVRSLSSISATKF